MSGTAVAGSYTALLRRPSVARTFVPALVGRLAYGVLPLSFLFTVQHATGSFSVAASALALNGLASLSMPLKSRAVDRHGQRLVIPLITAAMAVALVAAATMASSHVTAALPWLVAGLAVGLASPPLGPSMRAQWRALVPEDAIGRAYSLDAVGEETLYLIGPMIAAGLLAVAPTYAGLLVCALLVVVGAAGLAASPAATVTAEPGRQRMARGPLRHTPFLGLLLVMAGVGAVTAAIYTSTAARALVSGHPSYAGLADAAIAVGSVTGGLLWGRLRPALSVRLSLALLLATIGTASVVASALDPFWVFAAVLAIGGLAISPLYVVAYRASDALVDRAEATEASTWVNTVNNLGVSAGSAVAGMLVSHVDARAPGWAGGALALALAALLIRSRRRR
ncbi:MAG TPA: MFS transporter [Nocardioides sp.]|nr:MFS transporter [Nocardioides sp.]